MMEDEDDSLLLDNKGNIKSAQSSPTSFPTKPQKNPKIHLTKQIPFVPWLVQQKASVISLTSTYAFMGRESDRVGLVNQ